MSVVDVLSGKKRWHLHRGDMMAWLPAIPDGCADILYVDPPFSSGSLHIGGKQSGTSKKYQLSRTRKRGQKVYPEFSGDSRDQRTFLLWCAIWLGQCFRILKPGSPVLVHTDWRQLPTTSDALQLGGFSYLGIVVWDKTVGCRPTLGRFAHQAEYVVFGAKGMLTQRDEVGCLPGVFEKFPRSQDKLHMTGKPLALCQQLLRIVPKDSVVLDPFAGSSSSGAAALSLGMRYLGGELSPAYAKISEERLKAAEAGFFPEHAFPRKKRAGKAEEEEDLP